MPTPDAPMNAKWKVIFESPLVRPGIRLEVEVSERYLVPTLRRGMEKIREFNQPETPHDDSGARA